jgi:hypothetical protein
MNNKIDASVAFAFRHVDTSEPVYTWNPETDEAEWTTNGLPSSIDYPRSSVNKYLKEGTWVIVK